LVVNNSDYDFGNNRDNDFRNAQKKNDYIADWAFFMHTYFPITEIMTR